MGTAHYSNQNKNQNQKNSEILLAQHHKLIAHLPTQTATPHYKNSLTPKSPLLIAGKVKRHIKF